MVWLPMRATVYLDAGVYKIAMNASKTVQANFTQITYTLTANGDGNGSVTLSPTGGTYTSGTHRHTDAGAQ